MRAKKKYLYRKIGLSLLLVPVGFLSLFLIGEVVGGDITGLGHLFQIVPLVILWLLAGKYTKVMGIFLFILGLGLVIVYNLASGFSFPVVNIFLFFPIIISGYFLFISSQPKSS